MKNKKIYSLFLVIIILLVNFITSFAKETNKALDLENYAISYYKNNFYDLSLTWWDLAALSSAGYKLEGFTYTRQEENQAVNVASNIIGSILLKENVTKDVLTLLNFYKDGLFGDSVNDQIWSIIALNMSNVDFDKEKVALKLIELQKDDGGFSYFKDSSDVDMTGAALIALSILKDEEGVKEAIDKAVKFLKDRQEENGGFKDNDLIEYDYIGQVNPNSTAMAMIGLIDANVDIDEEFIKNQNSILDALSDFKLKSGGFFIPSVPNEPNQMAIYQVMVAVNAYKNGKSVFLEVPKETKKIDENKIVGILEIGLVLLIIIGLVYWFYFKKNKGKIKK